MTRALLSTYCILFLAAVCLAADPAPETPLDPLSPPPEPKPAVLPEPAPGYLGANLDNANGAGTGVVVLSVSAGGPADNAGLKPGDRVVRVNQAAVAGLDDFAKALAGQNAGQKVALEVSRAGRREAVAVTLGQRPNEAAAAATPRSVVALEPRAMLGVHASDVTDATRARYGLTVRRGAVIEALTPGSPADRAGLPLGGVIVSVDGTRIDTADELRGLIGGSDAGAEIELSYYRGDELQRKRVRLAPAPRDPLVVDVPQQPQQPQQPQGPRFAVRPGEDRPVLRALERALQNNGVVNGGVAGGAAPAPAPEGRPPFDPVAEIEALRAQVRDLRQQNSELERRVRELEQKLAKP